MNDMNHQETNNSDLTSLKLRRENWALMAHADSAAVMLHAKTETDLINGICRAIVVQSPYIVAWVGFAQHDEQKTVKVVGVEGLAANYARGLQVSWSAETPLGLGPVGTCIRTGLTVVIADSDTDPRFAPWKDRAQAFGIRSVIAVPIVDRNFQPIGSLGVYSSLPDVFTEIEIKLFKSLASDLSVGLIALQDKAKLFKESKERQDAQIALAQSLEATIEAMSRTMQWRDPYTAEHQRRVANIAVAIAKKMGWSDDRIEGLYLAAMVHDIGKLAIPAEILTKPTKLTDLEMQLMRGHVEAGYQILKDIPFPWPIAQMVHQHHERLDGSGYPMKIKGDQILIESQILAVADTLEAMSSHRPYRPAKGLKLAIDQIKQESGISLDAKIVDVACELLLDPEIAKRFFW